MIRLALETNRAYQSWTVLTTVVDVTITASMMTIVSYAVPRSLSSILLLSFQLYHAKSSAYFGQTRDRISRLLRLTVQTGFLTSILALPIAPLVFRELKTDIHVLMYVGGLNSGS